jgi:catechol-2,3-dioxygenase
MVQWYCNVLEGRVVYANDMLAFMTYDDEHHRVALIAIPGLVDPAPNATGTDHIAFTYDSLDDLLHTYSRLKDAGIEPYWTINHGPTTSFYYKDPDANSIELQIDNFATVAEVDEWMRRGGFEENPIGVIFDADDLVARHQSGVPHNELVERPPLPEGKTPFDMLRG